MDPSEVQGLLDYVRSNVVPLDVLAGFSSPETSVGITSLRAAIHPLHLIQLFAHVLEVLGDPAAAYILSPKDLLALCREIAKARDRRSFQDVHFAPKTPFDASSDALLEEVYVNLCKRLGMGSSLLHGDLITLESSALGRALANLSELRNIEERASGKGAGPSQTGALCRYCAWVQGFGAATPGDDGAAGDDSSNACPHALCSALTPQEHLALFSGYLPSHAPSLSSADSCQRLWAFLLQHEGQGSGPEQAMAVGRFLPLHKSSDLSARAYQQLHSTRRAFLLSKSVGASDACADSALALLHLFSTPATAASCGAGAIARRKLLRRLVRAGLPPGVRRQLWMSTISIPGDELASSSSNPWPFEGAQLRWAPNAVGTASAPSAPPPSVPLSEALLMLLRATVRSEYEALLVLLNAPALLERDALPARLHAAAKLAMAEWQALQPAPAPAPASAPALSPVPAVSPPSPSSRVQSSPPAVSSAHTSPAASPSDAADTTTSEREGEAAGAASDASNASDAAAAPASDLPATAPASPPRSPSKRAHAEDNNPRNRMAVIIINSNSNANDGASRRRCLVSAPLSNSRQLDKDLPRTLPHLGLNNSSNSSGGSGTSPDSDSTSGSGSTGTSAELGAALRRILLCFSTRYPDIGFVQGLPFVAAQCIRACGGVDTDDRDSNSSNECAAFQLLCRVLFDAMPEEFYTHGTPGLTTDMRVLGELLQVDVATTKATAASTSTTPASQNGPETGLALIEEEGDDLPVEAPTASPASAPSSSKQALPSSPSVATVTTPGLRQLLERLSNLCLAEKATAMAQDGSDGDGEADSFDPVRSMALLQSVVLPWFICVMASPPFSLNNNNNSTEASSTSSSSSSSYIDRVWDRLLLGEGNVCLMRATMSLLRHALHAVLAAEDMETAVDALKAAAAACAASSGAPVAGPDPMFGSESRRAGRRFVGTSRVRPLAVEGLGGGKAVMWYDDEAAAGAPLAGQGPIFRWHHFPVFKGGPNKPLRRATTSVGKLNPVAEGDEEGHGAHSASEEQQLYEILGHLLVEDYFT